MGRVERSQGEMQGRIPAHFRSYLEKKYGGCTSESDHEGPRPSKKSKYDHASSSEDEDETLEDAHESVLTDIVPAQETRTNSEQEEVVPDPPVNAAAAETGNDAEYTNEATVDGTEDDSILQATPAPAPVPAVKPPRPPRVLPTSFTPLAPVLASDMANNKYAPEDQAARQEYLSEVGNRQLHPSRTPLQTRKSQVSAQIRSVICERLFLGMTNDECIPTYNIYGATVTRGASTSKQFLPEVWTKMPARNVQVVVEYKVVL